MEIIGILAFYCILAQSHDLPCFSTHDTPAVVELDKDDTRGVPE